MVDPQFPASATIIPFAACQPRQARTPGADETRGAILFFTGVRYERQPEETVEPLVSQRPARASTKSTDRRPRKRM